MEATSGFSVAGVRSIATSQAFDNRDVMSAGIALARTSSIVSNSNPGTCSIEPNTRNTFHAGRVSPNGLTTPWKLCARPSELINVPAVSVKGAIGNSTSLNAILVLNAESVTTISAFSRAFTAAAPCAMSAWGSVCKSNAAFKPPRAICAAFCPPCDGTAPTTCAPTVLAASPK